MIRVTAHIPVIIEMEGPQGTPVVKSHPLQIDSIRWRPNAYEGAFRDVPPMSDDHAHAVLAVNRIGLKADHS